MFDSETKPELDFAPTEVPLPQPNPVATVSFGLWPPTQLTRDAVINRLIEALSTTSVLSKRYGTMSTNEVVVVACQIEDESFSVASSSASPDDDGIQNLQVYSKEISKRMLDTAKDRAPTIGNCGSSNIVAPSPAAAEVVVADS